MGTYDTFAHNNMDTGAGSAHVVIEPSSISQTPSSTITCHGINYIVEERDKPCSKAKKKKILMDVSGIFKPGMNAILGPTGSGKTSLLDVIAGRKDPKGLSGRLLVDGHRQPDNFKCLTGYVVQDDVVMGTLTVRENFMFSANLRLPSTVSQAEKKKRVEDIIVELGLTHVADSKVGNEFIRGISGGERKRTNIGMELIISPPVLFLDEPTTGLDASTANAVMLLLHRLASKGKTIIFSIHQPRYSIFKLFDRMTLLSLGHTVYHGPAAEALEYFSTIGHECEIHNNPADFFLDVINGDSTSIQLTQEQANEKTANEKATKEAILSAPNGSVPSLLQTPDGEAVVADKLAEDYKESRWHDEMKKEINPIEEQYLELMHSGEEVEIKHGEYATSLCTQLNYVCRRGVLNILRNPQTSFVQFFIVTLFAVLVGVIYLQLDNIMPAAIQNRVGALFFVIMNQVFGNLSAVELFIKERVIFIHESASGFYRVSSYFFAKVITDIIPQRLIPIIGFSCIAYFMVGFQIDVGKFFFFVLTLFLTATAACAVAFLISASFRVFAIANLFIALTYVFMMVFSGLLVNLDSMADWLSWIQYLSIFRYSLNALTINELKDATFCHLVPINGTTQTVCDDVTGNMYLRDQGIPFETAWDLWLNVMALGLIAFGFLFFTWLRLIFVKKVK